MPRNEHAKSSNLRNRQRITNKTRLKVVHGAIDADPVLIGEEDDRGMSKSTAGVDAEDAAEHHLQQVLNASRISSSASANAAPTSASSSGVGAALAPPPAPENYIPTPDAQGKVSNYDELYPKRSLFPFTIIKFSETPEECITWGLLPRSYVMDERDAAWLEQHNQSASGQGTSSSSPAARSASKSPKAKGKEPESTSPVSMNEDQFELVMGLFEKYATELFPFSHVDASIPSFDMFEPIFAGPLPASAFARFRIPDDLPQPEELARMAQAVHPHWHNRKTERRGKCVMPDLNLDESQEGNVYVCFRRREVKAVRKTRRMETQSADKLTRLSSEFDLALELCDRLIAREETKKELLETDRTIWSHRKKMIAVTNRFPNLRTAEDEKYLVEKERVRKARPAIDTSNVVRISRQPGSAIPHVGLEEPLDLGPPQLHPRVRYEHIQMQIEHDFKQKSEQNTYWDETTDMPFQPNYPFSQRLFRSLGTSTPANGPTPRAAQPAAFRLRIGRGGRRHIDRRMPPLRSASVHSTSGKTIPPYGIVSGRLPNSVVPPPSPPPRLLSFPRLHQGENSEDSDQTLVDEDAAKRLEERLKYDHDSGPRPGEEERTIVDDFNVFSMTTRCGLLKESDYLVLPDTKQLFVPIDITKGQFSAKTAELAKIDRMAYESTQRQLPAQYRAQLANRPMRPLPQGLHPAIHVVPPAANMNSFMIPSASVANTATPTTPVTAVPNPTPSPTPITMSASPSLPSPSPVPSVIPSSNPASAPITNGATPLPSNPVNGIISTPPPVIKLPQNTMLHPSPPHPQSVAATPTPIDRVATPISIRKMIPMPGTPQQGLQQLQPGMNPAVNGYAGHPQLQTNGLPFNAPTIQMPMYGKLINAANGNMNMNGGVPGVPSGHIAPGGAPAHFTEQQFAQIAARMNGNGMMHMNSAMNMNLQHMNLALGMPNMNMPLHLPGGRAFHRPATNMMPPPQQRMGMNGMNGMNGMGGMNGLNGLSGLNGMNGMNGMVDGMQGAMNGAALGMPVGMQNPAIAGLSISRAPSANGMHGMNGVNGMNGINTNGAANNYQWN